MVRYDRRRHPRPQLRQRRHRTRHHGHRRRSRSSPPTSPSTRDGNVVVVARVSDDSCARQLQRRAVHAPPASLDSSFDGDGITGFDPGIAGGVAIDTDGSIVVAGSFQSGFVSGKEDFAVWRFLANGNRDG